MSMTEPTRQGRSLVPLFLGLAIAAAYVVVAWLLYQGWSGQVASYLKGAMSGIDHSDPDYLKKLMAATDQAPAASPLLKVLLFPLPQAAIATQGGELPFWAVLVQGLWLGGVAWAAAARSTAIIAGTVAVPFVALFAMTGNIAVSLTFGLPMLAGALSVFWFAQVYAPARQRS